MKILLINNFHYRKGGSETVYFNTGRLLEEHGHKVVWFSFRDEANLPCGQSGHFVEKSSSTLGLMKDYFYNTKVRKALERLLEEEKPDIAHVHLIWGGMTPAIFDALRKYGVPLVHTVHDYRMVCPAYTFRNGKGEICEKCHKGNYLPCISNRCSKGSLLQSVMMAAEMYTRGLFHNPVKNIDGFIFVSRFCEGKHIEHNRAFGDARRIVLYNSVKVAAPESVTRGDYFLYYGRLSYEKGVEDLIRVFSRTGSPKLKIVGTGPMEESLRKLAEGACNIEFVGYRSGEPLFDLVRGCSFVIVPSRWYENNPMTIVEAYAFGKPVIGARIGGITEILEDTGCGFIYPSGDLDALSEAVEKACSLSDSDYHTLSGNSRSFYDEHFSERNYYERLEAFYESVSNNGMNNR